MTLLGQTEPKLSNLLLSEAQQKGAAMSDTDLETAFRVNELANAWKVSRSSLYRLMNSGHLAYIKMGGSRLVTRDQATDFLSRLKAETCR